MTTKCRLLACQITIPAMTTVLERDRHLEQTAVKIGDRLRKKPADIVVLPELSSIDYARATFDKLDLLAELLDGPSFEVHRKLARDFEVAIAYGIARREGGGYRISQVVLGPDGEIIGHFDKLHVAQFGASMEKEYFTPGSELFVFEHKGFTIAPIICYDIRFPELARRLVLDHGTELILHCGAYARDASFFSWHHFVVSRSLENQIFMLSLNRAGPEFGNSLFCGPWIDENTPAVSFPQHEEAFVYLDVDRAKIEATRNQYSFLNDRIEDYGALAKSGTKSQPSLPKATGGQG